MKMRNAGAWAEPRVMSPRRFRRILATYGASPARWPAAERDAALAYLRRGSAGETELRTSARLDHALDAYGAAQPAPAMLGPSFAPETLRSRDAATAARGAQSARHTLIAGLRPAALAGAALAGLVLGVAMPHQASLPTNVLGRIPAATVSGAQAEIVAVAVLDSSE